MKKTFIIQIVVASILSFLSGWVLMKIFLPNRTAFATFIETLFLTLFLAFWAIFIGSVYFAIFTLPPPELKFLDDSWLSIISISMIGISISGLLLLSSREDVLLLSEGTVVTGIVTDKNIEAPCGRRNPICYYVDYTYSGKYKTESAISGRDLVGGDLYNSVEIGAEVEVLYGLEDGRYYRSVLNDNFYIDIFATFIGFNLWPLYGLAIFIIQKKKIYKAK